MIARGPTIAAALASKAKLGLQPVVPGLFSLFQQATSGADWTVDATGRESGNVWTADSSSQATVARGSAGGIWQLEYSLPDYAGSSSILLGIGKAGQYNAGAVGQSSNGSLDGFAAWDLNGAVYHLSSGNTFGGGVATPWTATDVIGVILDATAPTNLVLYFYKNNTAPVIQYSTTGAAPATAPTTNADLTGDYVPMVGRTGASGTALTTIRLNSGQEAFKRFFSGARPWSG